MMKMINKILGIGLLALVVAGPAYAHGPGRHDPYGGWSGSATIWGNSSGYSGWSGYLSYGTTFGYAPGYIPWAGHRHGPSCHHGPGWRHPPGYGYRHGHHHRHGGHHANKHWKRHHRRH